MINLLVYITSTLFTYIFGIISKKINLNEILPIPVQNIIVGIITFLIAYLLVKPENIENTIEQIVVALGGSGTATLSYDLLKFKKEGDK